MPYVKIRRAVRYGWSEGERWLENVRRTQDRQEISLNLRPLGASNT